MKLFETPKAIADLEVNDIVYVYQDNQVKQAKLIDSKTHYKLESQPCNGYSTYDYQGVQIGLKSEYKFVTPDGKEIIVNKDNSAYQKSPIYFTINDLRDDKSMPFRYQREKDCQQAYQKLVERMKNYFCVPLKDYKINLYDIRQDQICEHTWREFMVHGDEIFLEFYSPQRRKDVWLNAFELIDSGKYYTTKQECGEHYEPKVMTF